MEHFWFLQKCSLFVSILTYTFWNRGPPPFKEKLPNYFVFADFDSRFNRPRPEIELPESDQIDQISPPPYCKTCFSTSKWFWHAKNYLVNSQKFWDWGDPPSPCWEKLLNNPVVFSYGLPKVVFPLMESANFQTCLTFWNGQNKLNVTKLIIA